MQKKQKQCDELREQLSKVLSWTEECEKKISVLELEMEKNKTINGFSSILLFEHSFIFFQNRQLRVELEGARKQSEQYKKKLK